MKKVLMICICLIVAIALSNCDISVDKVKAQENLNVDDMNFGDIYYRNINGMKYLIVIGDRCMTITNLTKDSLECAYYRYETPSK